LIRTSVFWSSMRSRLVPCWPPCPLTPWNMASVGLGLRSWL
jgi:hypothetical protein